MKALYFGTTGSLDHLIVAEIPRPIPRADEALVRICAAAINPSDPKNVLGKMPTTKLPCIPGRDFSGIVVDGPPNWRLLSHSQRDLICVRDLRTDPDPPRDR